MGHEPDNLPGLTSICIPNEDGTYQTIIDTAEIKAQLINQNQNHDAQAEHAAMAHHLIQEEMGVLGMSNFCNRVLLGMANLSHLPVTLQAIFRQLHQPHLVEVNNIISFDNYKDALQKWKESTSTSPSSCHLDTTSPYSGASVTRQTRLGKPSYNYTTPCFKSPSTAAGPTSSGKQRQR
jgi:hypothetical protein